MNLSQSQPTWARLLPVCSWLLFAGTAWSLASTAASSPLACALSLPVLHFAPALFWNHRNFSISPSGELSIDWAVGLKRKKRTYLPGDVQQIRCLPRQMLVYSLSSAPFPVPSIGNDETTRQTLCQWLDLPTETAFPTVPPFFHEVYLENGICQLRPSKSHQAGCILGLLFMLTILGSLLGKLALDLTGSPQSIWLSSGALLAGLAWLWPRLGFSDYWNVSRGRLQISHRQIFEQGPIQVSPLPSEETPTSSLKIAGQEIWRGGPQETDHFAEWLQRQTGWPILPKT